MPVGAIIAETLMREPIPDNVAADVLYGSNRTCCVCNEPGRSIQIHHIDGDPSNNRPENLAVLCLQCHNETEIRGGFGRQLTPPLVEKYRDEWIARVAARRARADELAVRRSAGLALLTPAQGLTEFIRLIPLIRADALRESRRRWDSGVSSEMLQGNYDYIAVLQNVLQRLVTHYPTAHFDGDDPEAFLSSWTTMLFKWHRARLEPQGVGSGGTMVGVMAGGSVIEALERMVEDLVFGLTWESESIDFVRWRSRWKRKPRQG